MLKRSFFFYLLRFEKKKIKNLITKTKNIPSIPFRYVEPEDAEANVKKLVQKVDAILSRLINKASINQMPIGLRVVAGYIAEMAKKYSPSKMHALVGGFIMLRFVI